VSATATVAGIAANRIAAHPSAAFILIGFLQGLPPSWL